MLNFHRTKPNASLCGWKMRTVADAECPRMRLGSGNFGNEAVKTLFPRLLHAFVRSSCLFVYLPTAGGGDNRQMDRNTATCTTNDEPAAQPTNGETKRNKWLSDRQRVVYGRNHASKHTNTDERWMLQSCSTNHIHLRVYTHK